MRKFFSLALAVSMILTLAITASAETVASGTCGDSVTWVLNDSGTLTVSGEGSMFFDTIESPWCDYANSIKSVIIEYGITDITHQAFFWHGALTSVTIPDTVTGIGFAAFAGCYNLKSIILPERVTYISSNAFEFCESLTSFTIPDGVKYIYQDTFHCCSGLKRITIPKSVTSIEEEAFIYCDSLTDIYYSGTEEEWDAITIGSRNAPLTNATIHFLGETKDPTFSTTTQAGYHAETKGNEKTYGEIAVTAAVTNLTKTINSNIKAIGFYFYMPESAEAKVDLQKSSKLDLETKSFYSIVTNITDYDKSFVILPYIIYTDGTVHTSQNPLTVSYNSIANPIWLGK